MDELQRNDQGRTAEDAPCICAHGEYKGDVASIPGTYAECDPHCGKCYWIRQDFLSTS
jgi:hypothetical protein